MGSLGPAFAPARLVGLAVKPPCCPCALRPIAIRPEGTVGRLRYPLGGDRPSQTPRQPRSPPCGGWGRRRRQGGISTSPPPGLAPRPRRLPPILHRPRPRPAASWSEAPRGLFVLPRVDGIFTVPSISPSPPSRQRPDRSTFRAGRNLPDKEFRYLRTVIVTAAVYRGFGSGLAPLPLTFRHWAGLSPYTSAPGAFAGTGVFGKQSPGPGHCGPLALRRPAASRYAGRPFSRSYGANLPSSLTGVLSSTSVSSTSPPVSVCGTGAPSLARGFSRQSGVNPHGSGRSPPLTLAPRSPPARVCRRGLPTGLEASRPGT